MTTSSAAARSTGPFTFKRPALAKDYYYVEGDSDGDEEATAPTTVRPGEIDAAARAVPSTRRSRRARPATIPMRRRINPLGLARMPVGLPAEQSSSVQLGDKKLAGLISRSLSSNSSAMMQAFHARRRVREFGRGHKAWSSLYMDHRKSGNAHPDSDATYSDHSAGQAYIRRMRVMLKLNNASRPRDENKLQPFSPWKPTIWERMFNCDYCIQRVSPGKDYTPCLICNVVAHAGCIRDAARAPGGGGGMMGSSAADLGGVDLGNDSRAGLGAEVPGVILGGGKKGLRAACGGGGGGGDEGDGTSCGSPRAWVCGHCVHEHLLQTREQAAAAEAAAARKKAFKFRGYAEDEYEPEQQTMLGGVTMFQARWRGLRTRRQLDELKYTHYRAWSFEVLGLDGIPSSSKVSGRDQAPGPQGGEPSSPPAPDPPAWYQVVVTVIQDMSPAGIEKSASPVQLFRFDTPALPATTPAAPAGKQAVAPSLGGGASSQAAPASTASGGTSSVEFNSEMFVPGTKPWTTVVLTVLKTVKTSKSHNKKGAKQKKKPWPAKEMQRVAAAEQKRKPRPAKERQRAVAADATAEAAAVAAAAPPPVFVGQGFLHLKSDLCRGTVRSLCLPLRPQQFCVDALQMAKQDHPPAEGLTVRARVRPLSDVTSKCGYIHVVFWSGRTNGPSERPARYFGLLAGSTLLLYNKACSQKPPRARLALQGASVWAKTALLQVVVSLRTPDDMGRTNFQINATSWEEVNAWRSRLLSASADDAPPHVHIPA